MSASTLRSHLESVEFAHMKFSELHEPLDRRIRDALSGYAPTCERIVGPTRVGKSMLLNALARAYPEERVNGVRHVPVLVVPVPSPVSPKDMPKSVLAAYRLPTGRGSSGDLLERVHEAAKRMRTKVMLFEEASHIVDVGTRVPPRAAGDWFKTVMDKMAVSIMLFGVPRLQKLFDSNEQLCKRAKAVREFRPYDYSVPRERSAFAACVATYASMFKDAGRPFALPLDSLALHCYLASGGVVGIVSAFINQLAEDVEQLPPGPVSLEHCAAALARIEAVSGLLCKAFRSTDISPVQLKQAHAAVLLEAGLAINPI